MKPISRPQNPNFSSGPCAKRPGWSFDALLGALVGRSHRAKPAKQRIQEVIDLSRQLLGLPDDYLLGIVPGSNTGAFEMAMWNILGERGVDLLAWESFGSGWVKDAISHLKLEDTRTFEAGYGEIPDFTKVNFDRDVVFTWNGTTSGVKVPNGDFIPSNRKGLTLVDATSAVFAMDMPWDKIDVATYSWQKVLGGEAAHGVLILSPRAVERLESYSPPRPLPKVFRLTKDNQLMTDVFKAATINTVSMICVEDCLDALKWAQSLGREVLVQRSQDNLAVIERWLEQSTYFAFLVNDKNIRSNTSICLKIIDPGFLFLPLEKQKGFISALVRLLENEKVAFDINSYRDAPVGLRIWGGATVEKSDIESLCQWLDWAFLEVLKEEF